MKPHLWFAVLLYCYHSSFSHRKEGTRGQLVSGGSSAWASVGWDGEAWGLLLRQEAIGRLTSAAWEEGVELENDAEVARGLLKSVNQTHDFLPALPPCPSPASPGFRVASRILALVLVGKHSGLAPPASLLLSAL